jgi:3-oxoacyl-[acyl-carrier protein] reductase
LSDARSRRIAVVSGGAGGIGRPVRGSPAAARYDIVLVDLLVPELERTASEIRDAGRLVMMSEADVASHSRAQAVAAANC